MELTEVDLVYSLADDVVVSSASLELVSPAIEGGSTVIELALGTTQEPGAEWTGDATAQWTTPQVQSLTEVTRVLTVVDQAGNATTLEDSIWVKPHFNPDLPVVSFLCPLDGDGVAPGVETTVDFSIDEDDENDQIYDYSVTVNDVDYLGPILGSGATEITDAFSWTPPADAEEGDTFEIRLTARDSALYEGSATITLVTLGGTVLVGDIDLDNTYEGQHLVLANGSFTALSELAPESLILLRGTTLQNEVVGDEGQPLVLSAAGSVTVQCKASINVSGRGYGSETTHPSATVPDGARNGGSHLGLPAATGTPGSTFGSLYRPQENGGGGTSHVYQSVTRLGIPGGGAVRIEAQELRLEGSGSVRANGGGSSSPYCGGAGAGGSIWIAVDTLAGSGTIEAKGGNRHTAAFGAGGGGAVAIEYGGSSGTVLDNVTVHGGVAEDSDLAGAGTLYLKGPEDWLGRLVVDNTAAEASNLEEHAATVLPALGNGMAALGSGGRVLRTDRTEDLPEYFLGHWVEIRTAEGDMRGAWRIADIDDVDPRSVELEPNDEWGEPAVMATDSWQGVYRFDSVTSRRQGTPWSEDPIRAASLVLLDGGQLGNPNRLPSGTLRFDSVTIGDPTTVGQADDPNTTAASAVVWSELVVDGAVTVCQKVDARSITAANLTVMSSGRLSHPSPAEAGSAESLHLDIGGVVSVEGGGAIDVSARGYGSKMTYPSATVPDGARNGGSHLGLPAATGTPGSTFGSVYRPQEDGGGGTSYYYHYVTRDGLRGGGAARIEAHVLELQPGGSVRANGGGSSSPYYGGAGAGGSVWISVDTLSGSGTIEARGGDRHNSNFGAGGGGAVGIEYVNAAGTVLDNLILRGGLAGTSDSGGAGTVYLRDAEPSTLFGRLIVDNESVVGAETVLPSLGTGTAIFGSSGETLVVDLAALPYDSVPGYFVGHWVDVADADGNRLKGPWRVVGVSGDTLTLEDGAAIAEGDLWRGVYLFDSITVQNGAQVVVEDHIEPPLQSLKSASGEDAGWNLSAPVVDRDAVTTGAAGVPGSYLVELAAGAVDDPDRVSELRVGIGPAAVRGRWVEGQGARLLVPGSEGRRPTLTVLDDHPALRLGRQVLLPPLPADGRDGQGFDPVSYTHLTLPTN